MTLALHAATVPSYLQMLAAMAKLVGKAEAWCTETGTAPADLLGRRLAPDMQPLAYQFKSTVVHSQGAIEGVRRGEFAPDTSALPDDFAPLRAQIAGAIAMLEAVAPAELDALVGRDMTFVFGTHRIDYTAEDFLLSFSQPNFYFHCATAYALLRAEGLAIGKDDYIGRPRRKPRR
jgi:hypothetical protein